MVYAELVEAARAIDEELEQLRARKKLIGRRMAELEAEHAASKMVSKLSEVEKAKLRAALEADAEEDVP